MKKILIPAAILLFASCGQDDNTNTPASDTTILIKHDTVPEIRKSVNPNAVAGYSEKINDELNDWKFAVSLYETERTFHYTIKMQAKEVRVNDSLTIPNFGITPKPELRKGVAPLTCIIGFLDKKGVFKEYKKVSFQNNHLRITTINTYYVAAYKTKVQ